MGMYYEGVQGVVGLIETSANDGRAYVIDSVQLVEDNQTISVEIPPKIPDGKYFIKCTVETSSGSFNISRLIVINNNKSRKEKDAKKAISDYVSMVREGNSITGDRDKKIRDIYQKREEDYIEDSRPSSDEQTQLVDVLLERMKLRLKASQDLYDSAEQKLYEFSVKIDERDDKLYNSLDSIGSLTPEILTGKDIIKSLDIIRTASLPYGYEWDEYLMYPLDENGKTLLPANVINFEKDKCILGVNPVESNPNTYNVPRNTADNIKNKWTVWDLVYILLYYILFKVFKILTNMFAPLRVWPLRYVANSILRWLMRMTKKMFKKISKHETKDEVEEYTDEIIESGGGEYDVRASLYLNTVWFDERKDRPWVWAYAHFSDDWAKKNVKKIEPASLYEHSELQKYRYIRKIDFLNDYISNGYIVFGDRVNGIGDGNYHNHNDRTNQEKYWARLNIARKIIDDILNGKDRYLYKAFENILVDESKNLWDLLYQVANNNINIYLRKEDMINARFFTDDEWTEDIEDMVESSSADFVNGLDDSVNISLYFKSSPSPSHFDTSVNNKLCIYPDFCYIKPEMDQIKRKYTPQLSTYESFDVAEPPIKTKLYGYKNYVNSSCLDAAYTIVKAADNNRRSKRATSEYLLNQTNLMIQTSLLAERYNDTDNSSLKNEIQSELEKSPYGKSKIDLDKKLREYG